MAKKTFEDNLARLEEITELMEKEETSLDKSVKLYKEGIDLLVSLGENLKKTKQQVNILKETAEGIFEKEAFAVSEE
ncbi:MAG: exodeoxyribonuclease VII small subunit [Clostridiales bacterium]|nr:exodeoxyribonuclease VII small subunit [Clostridiales bacterium]MCD8214108.1 exodeoxyribonuclease VII small subunit [Clostridiales bacterium]